MRCCSLFLLHCVVSSSIHFLYSVSTMLIWSTSLFLSLIWSSVIQCCNTIFALSFFTLCSLERLRQIECSRTSGSDLSVLYVSRFCCRRYCWPVTWYRLTSLFSTSPGSAVGAAAGQWRASCSHHIPRCVKWRVIIWCGYGCVVWMWEECCVIMQCGCVKTDTS